MKSEDFAPPVKLKIFTLTHEGKLGAYLNFPKRKGKGKEKGKVVYGRSDL